MSIQKQNLHLAASNPGPDQQRDDGQTVASFQIRYYQYLNRYGQPVATLPEFSRDPVALKRLYRGMVLTRVFDTKAVALQRTGQLGTYASSLGQEAMGVAIGAAMQQEDLLLPSYREYGAMFGRGVSMTEILLYWGGDERGMDYRIPREDFPICVPVASQTAHAVGVAAAFRYHQQPRVAVVTLGDGGSSKGDFYEALNLAGAWNLPVLFVINNNQWAISVPREAQSGAGTLAQKAIAGGIRGEQVDGNDIIAMKHRIDLALKDIRAGGRPVLIEALTYRMCDHTTADSASRYRSDGEVERHRGADPIKRLRSYMFNQGIWDEQQELELTAECGNEVEAAVKAYLDTPPGNPESMFDHLYAELPEALQGQRQAVAKRRMKDE
jgi:2-oxoisovalerate dehydrogenase E1 component alpha subunit